MAAHVMLRTWFWKNDDAIKAWEKLAEALRKAGLNIHISQVLEK